MRPYLRMVLGGLAAVAVLIGLSFVLTRLGFARTGFDVRALAEWLMTRGVKIVIIIVSALVVIRAATLAVNAILHRVRSGAVERDLEWQRRASTLAGILARTITSVVWFVAVLMLLRELAIDVLPLLTGAGIAGLAIGFGAQNLVRDVISGFFLLLEDQVRVGDAARINGVAGTIEEISLRTIVLRDGEGAVHVFPNGTVTSLANLSKHFSFAIADVKVLYEENVDRVVGIIRDVGAAMQADETLAKMLVGAIEVPGVESMDGGLVTIRARFKTLPLSQGPVAAELRRRLLAAMIARGVKPYSWPPRPQGA